MCRALKLVLTLVAILSCVAILSWAEASASVQPARPREVVDTTVRPSQGRTIDVAADGNFQAAIDEAQPGDRIVLPPRATYRGPFRLRAKPSDRWIIITTTDEARIPHPGTRAKPSEAAAFPKLVSSADYVVVAEPGAHHYRFIGLELSPASGAFLNAIVQLGDNERTVDELPHHIIFDRCYLHGDPKRGARRGIAMNSRHTAVIDSYLSDFKEEGADSQAIAGWNGLGPFRIANNYLEAAGENVMFGGADPAIDTLVPADIEVVRNHIAKPLRWKPGHQGYEGTEWTVKNLFELKNARRVLIDGNLFEYNWPQAQNGFAILFTVRNQKGRAPWSVVEDVTFSNNLVRHVGAAFNILGRDDNYPSRQTRRIAIRNNLFLDIGGSWGHGRVFQLLDGTTNVTIDHNTAAQTGGIVLSGESAPHTGFVFTNNIAPHNRDGIIGSGTRHGLPTLDQHFPGAVVRRNVIVGGNPTEYPRDNFFPATIDEVGAFVRQGADYRLELARRFKHAGTDGRDPGADLAAIPSLAWAGPLDGWTTASGAVAARPNVPTSQAHAVAVAVFWAAAGLLVYIYIGYPSVEWLRGRLRPRPTHKARIEPTVSVIVVAYNEGGRIARRIENLLALDYPRDRLQIIVGSDGSTDDTVVRARAFERDGVIVRAFYTRRGKAACLNDLVPLAHGELLVFADARQTFNAGAFRALAANFADPEVGAVSGELILTASRDVESAGQGTAFYWRYEKFIRSAESRARSMVGTTGAIYGIRRSLFEALPEDTILDDVVIPVHVARRGYRVVFEPGAHAYDQVSTTAREEFTRKARTIAGTFQLLAREPWLLTPVGNPIWFETVSHKALRLTIPALHAGVFFANLALVDNLFYDATLAAQIVFYAAASVGCVQRRARRRLVTVPHAVCLMAWATLVGFSRFLRGRQTVTWERIPPPSVPSPRIPT